MFRFRPAPAFVHGLLCGLVLGVAMLWVGNRAGRNDIHAAVAGPKLEVHLHRFQLKPGKLSEFAEWVQFEHTHHADTLNTLEREKMYAEAIFRDPERDPETIYWLEIRGSGGGVTQTSPLAVDKVYDKYMQDTLVPHSRRTMEPEYVLVPEFLQRSIVEHSSRLAVGDAR